MAYRNRRMTHICLVTMRHDKYDVPMIHKCLRAKFMSFYVLFHYAIRPMRLFHCTSEPFMRSLMRSRNINSIATLQISCLDYYRQLKRSQSRFELFFTTYFYKSCRAYSMFKEGLFHL